MIPVPMLYDEVGVVRNDTAEVTFRSLGIPIDCSDSDNLCVRAARLMQQRYSLSGVDITLDKRVPFGAGLGGGSSDATAVLLAMNEIFGLALAESELIDVAAQLGSDTAFFVRNTAQLCSGRGEVMQPIELDLGGYMLVLVKPEGVNISTREAYSGVKPAIPTQPLAQLIARPVVQWQGSVKNDFEPHIFAAHPTLAAIKATLLDAGASYAAMSGSGSTIFGLFERGQAKEPQHLRDELARRGVVTPYVGLL